MASVKVFLVEIVRDFFPGVSFPRIVIDHLLLVDQSVYFVQFLV